MLCLSRTILSAVAVTALLGATAAQADTIDFESSDLTGLYLPGDSFTSGAYTLTTQIDFGIVDKAVALGATAPTGNATQFYFNANDGALRLARTDGTAFSLTGFDAAFVPLDPASLQVTVLFATGTTPGGGSVTGWWPFAASTPGGYPFASYSTPAGFAAFANVTSVSFKACSFVGGQTCTQATQNNGQFAIDNLLVSAVPEPAGALLLALGLAGMGLAGRHAAR